MSFIKNQIEKSKRKGQLICICVNSINWNNRLIGWVRQIYSPEEFELEVVDENGQKKFKRKILFQTVKSIEIGGIYNENLEILVRNRIVVKRRRINYFSGNHQNLYKKLVELNESKTVCTFYFKTEFSIGLVSKVTKEEIGIKNITYEGRRDGISFFQMGSLTKIRTNSNVENRIEQLIG